MYAKRLKCIGVLEFLTMITLLIIENTVCLYPIISKGKCNKKMRESMV